MHYKWNTFALDRSKPTITAKNGQKIEPSKDLTEVISSHNTYKTPKDFKLNLIIVHSHTD